MAPPKIPIWGRIRYEGDCWIYTGTLNPDGYGVLSRLGTTVRVHRMAYEERVGPIPKGMVVMHICDRPACFNPAHLVVGTNQENTADKVRKGRQAKGEACRRNKLTESAVREILEYHRTHGRLWRQRIAFAKKFGVCADSISKVVSRLHWRHL